MASCAGNQFFGVRGKKIPRRSSSAKKCGWSRAPICLWLTAQPPEEIFHHAYAFSVREDIILATEEMNLTLPQVRALLKSPAPLADVYKDFSKLETDYMSIVAQCVEDRANDLLKKEQQQNPPKVYRQSVTYAREHGELQTYHASCHLNERCRDEIDAALAQRFDGMQLGAGAVEQVVAEYGLERTKYVLQRPFKPVMEMVVFLAQIEMGRFHSHDQRYGSPWI